LPNKTTSQTKQRIYTIGHSNHSIDTFLALLKKNQIEVLVDTRSKPYSKHAPHFALEPLSSITTNAGIKYVFLGKELGGRPEGEEFYDSEGHVLYWRLANSPDFNTGIRCLEEELQKHRVAILCSEEDPSGCHRRLLVGRVLARHGIVQEHIRGDGRLQSDEEVKKMSDSPVTEQKPLFQQKQNRKEVWRSIQSVSPKGRLPSSSEL